MLRKIILIAFSLTIFLSAQTLKDKIIQDDFLSNGFTGFIEFQNHKYLVSVGITEVTSTNIEAKINAITGAKVLAQAKLVKFIHNVKMQTKEELITKTIVTKNGKSITRNVKSQYIEIIKEKGEGILKNVIDIGKWRHNNEYFYALGIEL